MKRFFIPFLAAFALPNAINAETMSITKTEFSDTLTFGSFTGSMTAICHAEKKGFLSNNEKLEMIYLFTRFHRKLYKNKAIYNKDKERIESRMGGLFPNCLP